MRLLKVWKLPVHWQVLVGMLVGLVAGLLVQLADAEPRLAVRLEPDAEGRLRVARIERAGVQGRIREGDVLRAVGGVEVRSREDYARALAAKTPGEIAELRLERDGTVVNARARVEIGAGSPRATALAPFDFVAEIFLRLLQMLIVPLIVTSIVTGVMSVGNTPGALGRMGLKTMAYYMATSFLAILVGLLFVNMIQPGYGARIPLQESVEPEDLTVDDSFAGVILRMVPENVFDALSENGAILQVIFFSLLLGIFVTRIGESQATLLSRLFQAGFDVMMRMAEFVLKLVPLGVVALIARVVGASGLAVFQPLLVLMVTVVLALAVHSLVVLPAILVFVGRVSPLAWARAVWPALVMAFSSSSSAVTLPVTMRSVEARGGASNRVSSFVLPLGATINMDGTALYECVGVIFLAQYYAGTGEFDLTLGRQAIVVVTALLASVGAAGIPSAGLVMMTTILSALGLPLEGVFLLLAIDRPLDMLRTATNIWSDTTCAAVVARSEGEVLFGPKTGAGDGIPPED